MTARKSSKTTGKSMVAWKEELAKEAQAAANAEANTGGGQFFSLKSGVLSFQDAPLPGNRVGAIIIDHIFENVFYDEDYDPDVISPPTCFSFGRDENTMAPHNLVVEAGQAQHEECHGCPMNEWGSAEKGRGKACRNSRRLALLPAGVFDKAGSFTPEDDPDYFLKSVVGYLKIPPTSIKGFAGYVKQLAATLKLPPFAVYTEIAVVPDADSQFKVTFQALEEVPEKLLEVLMKRRTEIQSLIEFPYALEAEERSPGRRKPAAKAKRGAKAPARKSRRY